MSKKPTSWCDDNYIAHSYDILSVDELVKCWAAERNTIRGQLAASEVMKRIQQGRLIVQEKAHA